MDRNKQTRKAESFVFEKARSGDLTLRYIQYVTSIEPVQAIDRSFYVHSPYNPREEAERFIEAVYTPGYLHIIIGVGIGYMIDALINKKKIDGTFVFIEPHQNLYQKLQDKLNKSGIIFEQAALFSADDDHALKIHLNGLFKMGYISKFRVDVAPNYRKMLPEVVTQLEHKILEQARLHQVNFNTLVGFSMQWHVNYLLNLSCAAQSIPFSFLHNRWDLPAILISAGPSLYEVLPQLDQWKKHALLVAAGSAIVPLYKHGIRPHFVVSVDGLPENYRHFKGLSDLEVPIIYSPMLHYKILQNYRGQKIMFQLGHSPFFDWYNELIGVDPGTALSGTSVANVTLDLIRQMTSGPILFVGQDLGYTGGYSHAEGHLHRRSVDDLVSKGRKLIDIDANDGSTLKTDYVYLGMKRWFEDFIKAYHLEGRIFNATERGARIEGAPYVSIDLFKQQFFKKERDIDQELSTILSNYTFFETRERQKSLYEDRDYLHKALKTIRKAKKSAVLLYQSIAENEADDKILKEVDQLNAFDDAIRSYTELNRLLTVIFSALEEKYAAYTVNYHTDHKTRDIQIARKQMRFYQDFYRSIRITELLLYFIARRGH